MAMVALATTESLCMIIFFFKKCQYIDFPVRGLDANLMYAVTDGRMITDLDWAL